jgi:hypothetical protein
MVGLVKAHGHSSLFGKRDAVHLSVDCPFPSLLFPIPAADTKLKCFFNNNVLIYCKISNLFYN